jgi:hypothetical protein
MRRFIAPSLLLAALAAHPAAAGEKVPLHVRYVAGANAERTADFKKFLEAEFSAVTVTPGKDFDPKAGSYDVLVIDTRVQPMLPPDFTRPTLLLGSNGNGATAISENGIWTAHMAGSKFDWL